MMKPSAPMRRNLQRARHAWDSRVRLLPASGWPQSALSSCFLVKSRPGSSAERGEEVELPRGQGRHGALNVGSTRHEVDRQRTEPDRRPIFLAGWDEDASIQVPVAQQSPLELIVLPRLHLPVAAVAEPQVDFPCLGADRGAVEPAGHDRLHRDSPRIDHKTFRGLISIPPGHRRPAGARCAWPPAGARRG